MSEAPVTVWRVGQNSDSEYLLVLRDDASHLLPMRIGPCEAAAIWSVLQPTRANLGCPATHDLLRELIERLGGRLVKVVIDDLWNKVYYAKLYIQLDGNVVTVDARPSDAVAVALRTEASLFATEPVLMSALTPGEPDEADPGSGVEGV
jgi:bifunctional DNase/RNase